MRRAAVKVFTRFLPVAASLCVVLSAPARADADNLRAEQLRAALQEIMAALQALAPPGGPLATRAAAVQEKLAALDPAALAPVAPHADLSALAAAAESLRAAARSNDTPAPEPGAEATPPLPPGLAELCLPPRTSVQMYQQLTLALAVTDGLVIAAQTACHLGDLIPGEGDAAACLAAGIMGEIALAQRTFISLLTICDRAIDSAVMDAIGNGLLAHDTATRAAMLEIQSAIVSRLDRINAALAEFARLFAPPAGGGGFRRRGQLRGQGGGEPAAEDAIRERKRDLDAAAKAARKREKADKEQR